MVVSPHLDDGVFACGAALAGRPGSVVLTVFAGRPRAGDPLTEWDAAAGFAPGDDVIGARRAEDAQALAVLGARPRWLEFRDRQYDSAVTAAAVAPVLEATLGEIAAPTIVIPLGLFHSDHALVHEAARAVMSRVAGRRWLAYAEALYRCLPDLVAERIGALEHAGLKPCPVWLSSTEADRHRKRIAVARYRSQLRALATAGRPGHRDTEAPEEYWSLAGG